MSSDSSNYDNLECILHDQSSKPDAVPLRFLRKVTNNFSDQRVLGKGGTGYVYKGVLPSGDIIAVKRLDPLMVRAQSLFENEVHHLMRLNHPNIVRFMGYCYETKKFYKEYEGKMVFAETPEMLLCLEYLPKGSLDGYLSDGSSGLDWHIRYKIIKGICNGLHYLHRQIDKSILHLDLKPANVLLDDNLAPKITDFGLSRLLDQHQTISSPNRVGTFGYMAPEYIHEGTITPKSDIFSLGVIIIELIMGHKNYPGVAETSSERFIELELKKWRNTLQKAYGDTKLEVDCQQIKRCIQIGLICVNPEWTERPTTTTIIEMLQGLESSDFSISSETMSSTDQISKGLKRRMDYSGVTEESVFLAMAGDRQRRKLLYLENRVALARTLFPVETRVAMVIAQVDGTVEFTLGSSANPPPGTQRPTIDLNKTPFQMKDEHLARIRALCKNPFQMKDEHLARIRALSKTVELGRCFFPRCSSLLDKIIDDEDEPAFHGRDTSTEKRRRFHGLQDLLLKAFNEDKEEFGRSARSPSS